MAFAELDRMVASLKGLAAKEFPAEVAKEAAPRVDAKIKETVKAHQDPNGKPWPPRKKDGAPALDGIEKDIRTKAVGNIVRTTLDGPAVFSHYGAGVPKRTVIPDSAEAIPEKISKEISSAAGVVFTRITGG